MKNAAYVDAIIDNRLGEFLSFYSLLDGTDLVVVLKYVVYADGRYGSGVFRDYPKLPRDLVNVRRDLRVVVRLELLQ